MASDALAGLASAAFPSAGLASVASAVVASAVLGSSAASPDIGRFSLFGLPVIWAARMYFSLVGCSNRGSSGFIRGWPIIECSKIWSVRTVPVRSLVDSSSVNFICEECNPLTAPGNRNSTCCSFFEISLRGLKGCWAPLP